MTHDLLVTIGIDRRLIMKIMLWRSPFCISWLFHCY